MKEGKAGFENKGLVILLCVLVVAIIGLGVGVGVVWISGNKNNDETIAEKCEEKDSLQDIDLCVEDVYAKSSEIAEPVRIYEAAILSAEKEEDYMLAARLASSRTSFLVNNGYCDVAMNMLDEDSYTEYPAKALGSLYSYAIGASVDCGDNDAEERYRDLLAKTNEGIKDAVGF